MALQVASFCLISSGEAGLEFLDSLHQSSLFIRYNRTFQSRKRLLIPSVSDLTVSRLKAWHSMASGEFDLEFHLHTPSLLKCSDFVF